MSKFLDNSGLTYLWGKIKEMLGNKVDKDGAKVLTTNDFTNEAKAKLEGIDTNANKYTHPTHTEHESGLYKVTVDELGHVSAAEAVTKEDITNLNIPGENTTYEPATEEEAGLMSAEDFKKLQGFQDAENYMLKTDIEAITNQDIDQILAE